MRTVFLAHSFADQDRAFASQVERLIRSQGLFVATGKNLAGRQLGIEVTRRIEDADAVIALCTERAIQPVAGTHPWVLQEYAIGRAAAVTNPVKNAIAVWQTNIPVQGIDTGYEHIEYDPAQSTETFVRLCEVIGEWKQRAGRLLKVQLMPDAVALRIGQDAARVRCEYRWQADGKEEDWTSAQVRRELGGIFGYLRVPDSAEMIQVRATGPNVSCESAYTPVRMFVQMDAAI